MSRFCSSMGRRLTNQTREPSLQFVSAAVLRWDMAVRGWAIANPPSLGQNFLVTAAVCSTKTCKQLYRGTLEGGSCSLIWRWPIFRGRRLKQVVNFYIAPSNICLLEPPLVRLDRSRRTTAIRLERGENATNAVVTVVKHAQIHRQCKLSCMQCDVQKMIDKKMDSRRSAAAAAESRRHIRVG